MPSFIIVGCVGDFKDGNLFTPTPFHEQAQKDLSWIRSIPLRSSSSLFYPLIKFLIPSPFLLPNADIASASSRRRIHRIISICLICFIIYSISDCSWFLISRLQVWVNRLLKRWMFDYSLCKITDVDIALGSHLINIKTCLCYLNSFPPWRSLLRNYLAQVIQIYIIVVQQVKVYNLRILFTYLCVKFLSYNCKN